MAQRANCSVKRRVGFHPCRDLEEEEVLLLVTRGARRDGEDPEPTLNTSPPPR